MQLPLPFIEATQPLLKEQWQQFVDALKQTSPTSIRINRAKYKETEQPLESVPWCDSGYYLPERPSFTFDPLFHAGAYYVQEASSMFIEQAVKKYVKGDIKALDLCAAPGGKSSHLIGLLSENSLLVSNEVIKSRADILSENMTKTGYPNVIVTNNDPADIGKLTHLFDLILVDAPCSGEGMFRKDHEAIKEWSLSNVQLCKERQQRIIADIWDALKPDGIMVYSTCTYNKHENEENVNWIKENLGAEILPLNIPSEWNISPAFDENIPAYRFLPHKTKGEGFFVALLRKKSKGESNKKQYKSKERKHKSQGTSTKLDNKYKEYLLKPNNFVFFSKNDKWFAFPTDLHSDFEVITSNLKLVSAGVYVGEYKGKDFIPHHSLAMSNTLNLSAFPKIEIDWTTAISFLKKEALVFENQPKGYILLTFRNIPLGFVKNIGTRANNLYPQEWRIRSSFNPDIQTYII